MAEGSERVTVFFWYTCLRCKYEMHMHITVTVNYWRW